MFREGQFVRRGDLLARIDDRAIAAALEQAEAEKAQNLADLQAAELDLTRYNNLVRDEAIPRQTVERQAALVAKLRATLLANEAAIAAARVQLSHTQIVSPLNGRVGIRRVDPGNLVRPTDAEGLVTVTQMRPIAVTFTLPQELLPRLQPLLNDPAGAPVTAFERDAGAALAEGRLAIVDNQIDADTGTIRLKAHFPNDDGRLWPGQFVTVQLRTGLSENALVVPARAVQRGLEGSFVYRVRDGKAEAVPVTVEHAGDEIAVIGRGVAPGDTVVIDGQSRLKPGGTVRIVSEGSGAAAEAAGARP
jgi:RND family efflux transporter MFP subunit